ncbi:MAG: YcxB family protein [Lachnospiraceae bacterium]|nr:YcxB family protein [Lachnospiraceae bacterium]
MEIEFDVKISANVLYDYMLRHTYSSLSGIMGTLVGALMLVLFASNRQPICLIIGVVILLYLPWTLFIKSRQQALGTPAFKKPLHYRLSDDGIEVSQDETVEQMGWDGMVKAVSTLNSIIVYTTPTNACIFPKKDLGDSKYKVIEIISTHMPPKKVKIRG